MKKRIMRWIGGLTCVIVASGALTGFGIITSPTGANEGKPYVLEAQTKSYKKPKYIFTFIGDGMSYVQLNAAQVYQGTKNNAGIALDKLAVTQFPVIGSATTQDSTSFCPDSASTATAISSGIKTHSGVIGLGPDKQTQPESITEKLKEDGYKIGIVSSVSIDHATPAAFYAHVPSRGSMYDIALQLADSDFDYFAGGSLAQPTGKNKDQKDAFKIIEEKGYYIADEKDEIMALNDKSGKVYAINPELQESQAMHYDLDAPKEALKLKDFVKKGIDVLENEDGFFMMVEGGKIDWAGHANDARANIQDVIALDEAIQVAMDFAKAYPEETLIIVTGDHETGGMSIGQATTGYNTAFDILDNQKMSYVAFDELLSEYKASLGSKKGKLSDVMPMIKENFGLIAPQDQDANDPTKAPLVLSDYEYKKLETAFEETMKSAKERATGQEVDALYGGYEPLTVTLTHILNNKAGIGWTSYSHTGVPVPVYAMGAGSELFAGSYDNTDIFKKLVTLCELK
ncbi:MAG: alkaline phosphatase [Cellulosilyticaceae bacterium]